MKLRVLFICASSVLPLATTEAPAFTPAYLWSERFGGTDNDIGRSVVADAAGNVYLTGDFSGAVDFGGGGVVSAGLSDIFLAKYDSNGIYQWSRSFGNTGSDVGYSVAVDGLGSIVLTGEFEGTVDFGVGNLVSAGSYDIFVAKYDADDGSCQWSLRIGGVNDDRGNSVALDASGNVLVTGSFRGTVDFGGGNLVSAGSDDIFIAKFDANGVHQWSQRFGGTGTDGGLSVAVDLSGMSVLATGQFQGTADFGGGNLVSAGSDDIFFAKYDANGVHQWSQRFGGTGSDIGHSLATDGSGNALATGQFTGSVDFGGGNLIAAGDTDVFLAKYSSNGSHQWSQRFGGVGINGGTSVAADGLGNALVTGTFSGTANFGSGSLVSAGSGDIFLAKFDTNGVHVWSKRFGGVGIDVGGSVFVDGSGSSFGTGVFSGTAAFGGGSMMSAGSWDVFLVKYGGTAAEPLITSVVDVGNDQGRRVRIAFMRSGQDDAGADMPIVRYEAYLRDDPAPLVVVDSARESFADDWLEVASISAHAESAYLMDAPTDADSTEVFGQNYSVFFIRAATENPSVFFDSPIDSGYSLDNLAPGIPGSLLYSGGILSWNESQSEDFDYFTVYGGDSDAFAAATLVDYTVVPSLEVAGSPYAFYFVTATDFSGNEGNPATINTASGVGGTRNSYVLSVSNSPNPFNPRTTVRFTVPSRAAVTIAIYDARGALVATLVNHEERDAGAYRVDWDGRADGGGSVASGVYFARIEHDGVRRTRKMLLIK